MNSSLVFAATLLITSFGVSLTHSNSVQESPDKSKETAAYKISAEDAAKVNPVKSTPEGLGAARKVFGYDCAMCHGEKGDGKGEVVESMKLTMRDWREPATLAGKTDGELFYIITKGKGKMMAEGDRVPEKLRWDLVNLGGASAAKPAEQKSAATTPAP